VADLQVRAPGLRRNAVAAAAVGAALLLSGCAGSSFAQQAGSNPPTSTAASSAPSAGPAPMDTDPTDAGIPTTLPPDVPAGERTPADVAGAAMTAFAVSAPVDPDAWYRRIAPYLTPEARQEYVYTDPANVPVHQLVGVATVTRQTDYLADVTQGTDAGLYTVRLARDDDGAWKVYRIDPPADAGS